MVCNYRIELKPGFAVRQHAVRHGCTSVHTSEYRELLHDPHHRLRLRRLPRDAFELVQCAVNGTDRPIRRTQRKGSQLYTATIPETTYEEVTISCTYRVLVQRHGHLLYLDIPRPTKGLQVQLWYGDCGIRRVNTLDFIASAQEPRILRSPASVPTPSVDVGFDGWIFPKSGVAFVWVLESELGAG